MGTTIVAGGLVSQLSPLETVRAFIRAIERNDLERALELVAEQCEYDNVPMGKMFGVNAIRAALGPFLASATEVEWVIHREASTDGVVFNERVDRFRFANGWVEIPVTGVWEVTDGKISLWRDYFDEAMFRSQMPQQ